MTVIKSIIKNYSKSPFFLLVWILIGRLLGSMIHGKEEMAFRLLVVILGLIVLNGLVTFVIGWVEEK